MCIVDVEMFDNFCIITLNLFSSTDILLHNGRHWYKLHDPNSLCTDRTAKDSRGDWRSHSTIKCYLLCYQSSFLSCKEGRNCSAVSLWLDKNLRKFDNIRCILLQWLVKRSIMDLVPTLYTLQLIVKSFGGNKRVTKAGIVQSQLKKIIFPCQASLISGCIPLGWSESGSMIQDHITLTWWMHSNKIHIFLLKCHDPNDWTDQIIPKESTLR